MTTSITKHAINFCSKYTYENHFKSIGWKRKSPHLFCNHEDIIHCCSFQASQWGSSDSGKFTINLSVTWPSIYETWTTKKFPANPGAALFPITRRIGEFDGKGIDKWWEVDAKTNFLEIAQEITNLLKQSCALFFQHYPNTDAVYSFLKECKHVIPFNDHLRQMLEAEVAVEKGEHAHAIKLIRQQKKIHSGKTI